VNRTRSHRVDSGGERMTRRSGGGGGGGGAQERAFANHDSGPMASRISALPAGVVDRRMRELDLSEVDMERRVHLSRGAVSDVYKVRWCGVSAVLKQWHSNSDAERFKNEVDITRLCQFPRVVQLFGASLEHRVMLIERLGRGNLRQVLTSEKYTLSSIERHLRNWALEVAEAMAFVHANGVIHYDLKSQNVLVTMSWSTRLCDFSHSVYVGTPTARAATSADEWGQVGSLEITAPEVFTRRQRTPKSDVYSFGLLLWEMLSYGETPFLQYCTDARALQTYVCPPVNGRPPLKSTWDPHIKDIMRRAWHMDAASRPTFVQLIALLNNTTF
jgi:c-src tyrosine kinase